MNTLEKQDIERFRDLIDYVKDTNDSDVVLFTYSDNHAKMFEDIIPGVKVLLIKGCPELSDSDNKVYIIPYEYRPIKFTCE